MRVSIVVQNAREDFLTLDVGPDTTVALLKASIAVDAGIPDERQRIFFNDQLLADNNQTLDAAGVKDGDMVSVRDVRAATAPRPAARSPPAPNQPRAPPAPAGGGGGGGGDEVEALRQEALRNPPVAASMRHARPELAAALPDPVRFRQLFEEMRRAADEAEAARRRQMEALAADDAFDDPDKQRQIEELIREKAVEANLQHALEWLPESFGRVYMLYVPVEVNGHPIKAFVDSGAQATIVSPACAARCNIMRLLDTRYAGVARGVGTARILGRVHAAQMRIGRSFLGFSATVMEGKGVDLLLGLDMLKGFRACIDLGKGVLRIGDDEVPFLGEADIPKPEGEEAEGREGGGEEGTGQATTAVPGPAGTHVDGRTGAVMGPAGDGSGSAPMGPASAAAAAVAGSSAAPSRAQAGSSSAQQPPARSGPAPGPARPAQAKREDVEQLLSMGFSEAEAIQALALAGGNVDLAASMLFGG